LSIKTGLPVTVLSRYVKGHVLPNSERSHKLWKVLSKIVDLEVEFRKRIKFNSKGLFDNTSIIGDINLLEIVSNYALVKFAGKRITKVLTAAVDGVPLASIVAGALGVNIVIAKPTKEVAVSAFIEETYTISESGHTVTLYLPKASIKKGDSVLVVDDIIRSGDSQAALLNLVKKVKAEVSGIFIMIAVGNIWKKTMQISQSSQVEFIIEI
jgi:adenine/guanine phosphoribosyltransferase-like PRPP-binding protein